MLLKDGAITKQILDQLISSVVGVKSSSSYSKTILTLKHFKKLYSLIIRAKAYASEASTREEDEEEEDIDEGDEIKMNDGYPSMEIDDFESLDEDGREILAHQKLVREYFERLKERPSDTSILVDKLIASPEVQEAVSDGDLTREQIDEVLLRRMNFPPEEWSSARTYNPDARMIYAQFEFFLFSIREFFHHDDNEDNKSDEKNSQVDMTPQSAPIVTSREESENWEETVDFAFLFEEVLSGDAVDITSAAATKEKIDIIQAKSLPLERIIAWDELKLLLEAQALTANQISAALERACDILVPAKVLKTAILANSTDIKMSTADKTAIQSINALSITFQQFKQLLIILDSLVDREIAEKNAKIKPKEKNTNKHYTNGSASIPVVQKESPPAKKGAEKKGKKADIATQPDLVKSVKVHKGSSTYDNQNSANLNVATRDDDNVDDDDASDYDDMDEDEELGEDYKSLNTVSYFFSISLFPSCFPLFSL